jgi:hypothetical protein
MGVLKGSRCEGIIYNPKGKVDADFAWVLGIVGNNEAKAIVAYQ